MKMEPLCTITTFVWVTSEDQDIRYLMHYIPQSNAIRFNAVLDEGTNNVDPNRSGWPKHRTDPDSNYIVCTRTIQLDSGYPLDREVIQCPLSMFLISVLSNV